MYVYVCMSVCQSVCMKLGMSLCMFVSLNRYFVLCAHARMGVSTKSASSTMTYQLDGDIYSALILTSSDLSGITSECLQVKRSPINDVNQSQTPAPPFVISLSANCYCLSTENTSDGIGDLL